MGNGKEGAGGLPVGVRGGDQFSPLIDDLISQTVAN